MVMPTTCSYSYRQDSCPAGTCAVHNCMKSWLAKPISGFSTSWKRCISRAQQPPCQDIYQISKNFPSGLSSRIGLLLGTLEHSNKKHQSVLGFIEKYLTRQYFKFLTTCLLITRCEMGPRNNQIGEYVSDGRAIFSPCRQIVQLLKCLSEQFCKHYYGLRLAH